MFIWMGFFSWPTLISIRNENLEEQVKWKEKREQNQASKIVDGNKKIKFLVEY